MAWIGYCSSVLEEPLLPLVTIQMERKLQMKTEHVINTSAQFVTLNNNNKLSDTLLNYAYWNFPLKATSMY